MNKKQAYFVISLDFELFWGMSDKYTLEEYGANVLGERTAIPRMLKLFKEHGIHATWATVGMLMARNRAELDSACPPHHLRPQYDDMRLSSYYHMEQDGIGTSETDDPYHYGETLLKAIIGTPHQEIGNHTFSHYYAVDGERNGEEVLRADLTAHASIAQTYGVTTESIVFPRNQTTETALRTCAQSGIRSYRGNEDHILYRARKDGEQSLLIRAFRLLDHYINMSGHHTYELPRQRENEVPLNIPSSRFFRPFMPRLRMLEPLRLRRIKRAMTHAAKQGEVFHLWWHPHNLGINQEQNFANLTEVLLHFRKLKDTYGMQSASMCDIVRVVCEQTV